MTEDGLANVVLTSPDIAGMAVVTARAGVADGQTEIGFDVMAPDENRIYLPLIKLPLQTRAQAAAYARKRRSHEQEGSLCISAQSINTQKRILLTRSYPIE